MAERRLVVKIVGDASSIQRSFVTASRSTKQFSNDLSRAERGVLAGSGVFRSLGRSLAFASGGFLAFGGAAAFLRKSVDAAKEAQVAQRQLATQLANNGKSFADYRGQIDKTVLHLSALAGIQNDELTAGLTTILRTTPNVGKALRDLGTAADLARAKHISLGAAATSIAKTEAGNTTLLRRQGFQIAKNATSEQALAKLRSVIAGQAKSGTTEQERFGAVLHDTEEIIGLGILPTLNKYLVSGTKWLEQMNESGKLQKDVASAAKDFETVMHDVASVVKTVDRITGSFKNTLELLIGLKVAKTFGGLIGSVGGFGAKATAARGSALSLSAGLGNAGLAAQAGVASFAITTLTLKATGLDKSLRKAGGGLQALLSGVPGLSSALKSVSLGDPLAGKQFTAPGDKPGELGGVNVNKIIAASRVLIEAGQTGDQILSNLGKRFAKVGEEDLKNLLDIAVQSENAYRAVGTAAVEASAKAAHGLARAAEVAKATAVAVDTATAGLKLTATQRNTFFDNAIARILLRGGLGNIQQQISALTKADVLIAVRIKATKDVTRRLKLEDELLQNVAAIKGLKAQQVADVFSKRQAAVGELIANLQLGVTKAQATAGFGDDLSALRALQAGIQAEIKEFGRTAQLAGELFDVKQQIAKARKDQAAKLITDLTSKQFRQLGLSATGDEITPQVPNLKKRLQQITETIAGTNLDTPKLESQLSRFRKVLSEGLVPKDVRAKIREMLDGISAELKSRTGDQTKFQHISSQAFVDSLGLGLTGDEKRRVMQAFSQVGAGGTVPAKRSQAFALAGPASGTVQIDSAIYLDGQKVGKSTTRHQQKDLKRRRPSRRG